MSSNLSVKFGDGKREYSFIPCREAKFKGDTVLRKSEVWVGLLLAVECSKVKTTHGQAFLMQHYL